MASRLEGNLKGLSKSELKALERIYRRRIPASQLITPELARYISELSREINRQIGILVNRRGNITHVIVGNHHQIVIPDLSSFRYSPGRLKGLRCIHTHLNGETLTDDDINDLLILRLDAMVNIKVSPDGFPQDVEMAYILPINNDKKYDVISWKHPSEIDLNFSEFILDLEDQLKNSIKTISSGNFEERAILICVTKGSRYEAERALEELKALALSANVKVLEAIIQRVRFFNPELLMGKGKLQEIIIKALQLGATMIIFDNELSPAQVNNIAKLTDLKVIDRNQLILDIFAKRAQSMEGKIQVELAQLKYLYPRIIGKGEAMSRLTGGIGGRGPGETKLEIDRRRIRKKIGYLEKQLERLKRQRKERRKRRKRSLVPIISIVGYTNAGKSTLINALTGANVYTENKLFATLDPTNRSIYIPDVGNCIITDTVGFIKNMPEDLKVAFRATLEELEDADLLIHLVDVTSNYIEEEIEAVEEILEELNLLHKERLIVYNKMDLIPPDVAYMLEKEGKLLISAQKKINLDKLILKISDILKRSIQDKSAGFGSFKQLA